MATTINATRLAVIAYLCVLGNCSCSNGTVQGIIGEGVSLNCMSPSCGSKKWRNDSLGDTSAFIGVTRHTSVNINGINGGSYELHIFNMSTYDVGSYSCWCHEINKSAYHICSDSVELICQAKVVVNNAAKLHNSSNTDAFPKVTIDANVRDTLEVKCSGGAVPSTNCFNVLKKESARFTYKFKVLSGHNNCTITCQTKAEANVICSIKFTIKVSRNKTSTHSSTVSSTVLAVSHTVKMNETPLTTLLPKNITLAPAYTTMGVDDKKDSNMNPVTNKPVSFIVIIVVCILVFILVIVTSVVSFCIFSLRSKSRSQSTQNVNVVNPPTDANVVIGPTYATVNKSSNGCLKGDNHPVKLGVPGTDGFYSEVDSAGNEESTTHQPNSQQAETSVTNDYYSEVNNCDVRLKKMKNGQETDITLYSGVNKGEEQPRRKECTPPQQSSGADTSVSDVPIYHVLEESKTYDNESDDATTSQVLYAVVDKDT